MRSWATIITTACGLLVAGFAPISNAGEKVFFVSDRDEPGNWDIYVIDVETQVVRRLTTDPAIDNHPDVSPDGTQVVWSSTRDPGGNPEGDFEILLATDDGGPGGLENGTLTQLTFDAQNAHMPSDMRSIPDRHPHFNHDPDDLKIIYTAKYFCVRVVTRRCVSVCSVPHCITTVDECGRYCEAMRIIDVDTLEITDIDHDMLTAANPAVWPTRPLTDARWIGHPDFSHDGSQILFSGAVDGQGRNWEVYVADWDGQTVTDLRQVTDGSDYPANSNVIKMNAGATFSHDGSTILYTSTLTEFGNSQLFELPASADKVPTSSATRHAASSDLANDYVPHFLEDGRIVVTSDREDYKSLEACCGPPDEYVAGVDSNLPHVIRVEASGERDAASGGRRIHFDAYTLGLTLREEDEGTAYVGPWLPDTSPNASTGYYMLASDGTLGEFVDIAIPTGTSTVRLLLGQTPSSGVARIYIDGVPITNGNYELMGDPPGSPSGWNLYTPHMTTSNDLDLVIIDGGTATDLTGNDLADEMLLIGDEVSWFCGLSPNVSLCTYLPKYFTIGRLRLAMERDGVDVPVYYPSRCLYPIAYQALDQFMGSGGNGLRPGNTQYWEQILFKMDFGGGQFDDELVVLPTPVNFCIENEPPSEPADPQVALELCDLHLLAAASIDPDGDSLTYDVYASRHGEPLLIVASDMPVPEATLCQVESGLYQWRVVAKDCRGGLTYGPVWQIDTHDLEQTNSWGEHFDSYWLGTGLQGQACWKGWDDDPAWDAFVTNAQARSAPHSVDIVDAADLVREFCEADAGQWTFTALQYVPGNFESSSFFILLNTYNDGGPYSWSCQLRADSITNTFIRDGAAPAALPLISDRWVEIRVEIDLDIDRYRVFYDDIELGVAESWTATVFGGGGGVLDIAALDLYANGSTSVYYDDISLEGPSSCDPCDMNCDGNVNAFDIEPFLDLLFGKGVPCDACTGDVNGDGNIDAFDIEPFLNCLFP